MVGVGFPLRVAKEHGCRAVPCPGVIYLGVLAPEDEAEIGPRVGVARDHEAGRVAMLRESEAADLPSALLLTVEESRGKMDVTHSRLSYPSIPPRLRKFLLPGNEVAKRVSGAYGHETALCNDSQL